MDCMWSCNGVNPTVWQKWSFILLTLNFDCKIWNFYPVTERLTLVY